LAPVGAKTEQQEQSIKRTRKTERLTFSLPHEGHLCFALPTAPPLTCTQHATKAHSSSKSSLRIQGPSVAPQQANCRCGIPFGFQSSCSLTDFKKSPTPTNPSAYFATGFRYVGIRKIMTFPGLFQTLLSVVFVGAFSSAIVVVFASGISVLRQLHFTAT
jgi:hypothetical protein